MVDGVGCGVGVYDGVVGVVCGLVGYDVLIVFVVVDFDFVWFYGFCDFGGVVGEVV